MDVVGAEEVAAAVAAKWFTSNADEMPAPMNRVCESWRRRLNRLRRRTRFGVMAGLTQSPPVSPFRWRRVVVVVDVGSVVDVVVVVVVATVVVVSGSVVVVTGACRDAWWTSFVRDL